MFISFWHCNYNNYSTLDFCRRLNSSLSKKLTTIASTGGSASGLRLIASSRSTTMLTVPKATPSIPGSQSVSHSIVILDAATLRNPTVEEIPVDNGRFGSCTLMVFKESFEVYVKKFGAIKAEASIMTSLNAQHFSPHRFGVNIEHKAIVMSYISINGQPLSWHKALAMPEQF